MRITAAGLNPADLKHAARAASYPWPLGYEIAGQIAAVGADVSGFAVGDPVLAFRVRGGFATALNVPAADVLHRPSSLGEIDAATLLLASTTAADMLHTVRAAAGETIVVFGASGSVGLAAMQLGRRLGARMIGVSGDHGRDLVGDGWTPRGTPLGDVDAALDTIGSDGDVDAALAAVADRSRIVTVAAPARAASEGFAAIAGNQPASAAYRDGVRQELVDLAASGALTLPIARTFPLTELPAALALVSTGHPAGKVAVVT